jgi:hypothetical protein
MFKTFFLCAIWLVNYAMSGNEIAAEIIMIGIQIIAVLLPLNYLFVSCELWNLCEEKRITLKALCFVPFSHGYIMMQLSDFQNVLFGKHIKHLDKILFVLSVICVSLFIYYPVLLIPLLAIHVIYYRNLLHGYGKFKVYKLLLSLLPIMVALIPKPKHQESRNQKLSRKQSNTLV